MSNFISTPVVAVICQRCKGWVFEGMVNGFKTAVDPIELEIAGELAARIARRAIYQTQGLYRPTLSARKLWHINKSDPWVKVYAEHDHLTPHIFEPAPIYPSTQSHLGKEPQF